MLCSVGYDAVSITIYSCYAYIKRGRSPSFGFGTVTLAFKGPLSEIFLPCIS